MGPSLFQGNSINGNWIDKVEWVCTYSTIYPREKIYLFKSIFKK